MSGGEAQGFVHVMRDEDDRLAALRMEATQFRPEDQRGLIGSSARERLVHQDDVRVGGERAGDADALLLTAGQLARIARQKAAGRFAEGRRFPGSAPSILARLQPSRRGTASIFSAIVQCGKRPTDWIT